jgi:hypothetical protein
MTTSAVYLLVGRLASLGRTLGQSRPEMRRSLRAELALATCANLRASGTSESPLGPEVFFQKGGRVIGE